MTPLGEAALDYARRGWRVFPLRPRSKAPDGRLAPRGFKDATCDPERVRFWWAASPEANIGLRCAPQFLVLDVDPRNGGAAAIEALFASAPKYGFETLTSRTGGGGWHYIFKHPPIPVRLAQLAPGVDIKSNGYIVAPPSVHPSGLVYEWIDPEAEVTDPPPWLLDLIQERERAERTNTLADDTARATIAEGQRNSSLFRLGCALRARGLSEEAIRAALAAENLVRCSPPLPPAEVEKIAASAARYEPGCLGAGAATPGGLTAEIRIEAATIAELNRLAVWDARIAFTSVRRRGSAIEAETTTGRLVRLRPADLTSFSKLQQAVAAAAGVWIPTPPRAKARPWLDQAAAILLALAERDSVGADDPIALEAAALLRESYEALGRPQETAAVRMGDLIEALKMYQRWGESGPMQAPVVFLAEGACWVHVRKWRSWLGTPRGLNRHYSVAELHDLLAALAFQPQRDVTRCTTSGAIVKVDLWCGDTRWVEE